MKRYFTHEGGYIAALGYLRDNGGCLFPAKRHDGSSTVVIGDKIHTFWERDSLNRAKVQETARQFGFDPEHATGGRLAKWILRDICGLHTTKNPPDSRFLELARAGFHWHYTHVEVGRHQYLLEFDIVAAYMTSLLSQSSLKFSLLEGEKDDGGALDCLRQISSQLPKWLRLIIIGTIASHRMQYLTLTPGLNGYPNLKCHTVNKVEYGDAFNAVHRAIFRVYRTCENIHKLGGQHIKRMHTDSFALTGDCPVSIESDIFNYLDSCGFSYSCKSQGSAIFFNLNEGLIGSKFVGSRTAVREQWNALERKPKRFKLAKPARERWGNRGVVFDTSAYVESLPTAFNQLEIMDTDIYLRTDEQYHQAG